MKNRPYFEGGPMALNSGGMGPDDYMLRKQDTRRWYFVVFEFGRNFTGDREVAIKEFAALKWLLKNHKHRCVPDNAKRYSIQKAKGTLITMSGREFARKYGWKE